MSILPNWLSLIQSVSFLRKPARLLYISDPIERFGQHLSTCFVAARKESPSHLQDGAALLDPEHASVFVPNLTEHF
jgi:hypothetical protein